MEKTIKLRSQSLAILNESLRKLILSEEVTKISPVIVEADGKFSSVIKTDKDLNTKDLSNLEVEEEKPNENKQQLMNKAADTLKKTIKNSKELDEILKKIKKLTEDDNLNTWTVNDNGNTASLKNKNAYIFKQNNNLCLSHNGKIELFKSVAELRKWLKDNNYPLPDNNVEIHESTLTEEDKKKVNSTDFNWFNLIHKDKEASLQPEEINSDTYTFTNTLNLPKNKDSKQNYTISPVLSNAVDPKDKWSDYLKHTNPENLRKSLFNNQIRSAVGLDPDREYPDIEIDKKYYKNFDKDYDYTSPLFTDDNIFDLVRMTREKEKRNREADGLGKAISKQDYNFLSRAKKPTKLTPVRLKKNTQQIKTTPNLNIFNNTNPFTDEDISKNVDECCGCGTATSGLGSAVTYLGNKKQENLEENYWFDNKMPKSHTKGTQTNQILSLFGNDEKYQAILDDEKSPYKNKEALEKLLAYVNDDYYKNNAVRHRILSNLIGQNKSTLNIVKEALDAVLLPELIKQDNRWLDNKKTMYINLDTILRKENKNKIKSVNKEQIDKELLDKITSYIKEKFPGYDFKYKLVDPNILKTRMIDEYTENIVLNRISENNNFLEEIENALIDSELNEYKQKDQHGINNIQALLKNLSNNKISNEVSNDINDEELLKQYNISPDDPKASALLKVLKMQENTLSESSEKYSWIKKITGQRLVEDDSPADFATGSPLTGGNTTPSSSVSEPSTDVGNNTSAGPSDDFDLSSIDADAGGNAGNSGFGDIDINVGGGDYSMEGDEEGNIPMIPTPDYKIIDVLVNDDNPDDIKIKVEDQDTKKTELKNLDEIDV